MTPLRAFAFMVFTLIYTPCISTIAAVKRETGSYKWTAFSVLYSLILAWVLAYIIIRAGMLFGLS
jgi:ferrous iron transport protein B